VGIFSFGLAPFRRVPFRRIRLALSRPQRDGAGSQYNLTFKFGPKMSKQYGGNVNIEAAQSDGLPLNERRWAILSCAIGLGMASLDTAIANTALPTMASQLHTTPAASMDRQRLSTRDGSHPAAVCRLG
jgi:hypothetical protein